MTKEYDLGLPLNKTRQFTIKEQMMKLPFKTLYLLLVFTSVVISFSMVACTSGTGDREDAYIVLDFGDAAETVKAVAPNVSIDQLRHAITFIGPTGIKTYSISGAGKMTAAVAPGIWRIDVEGYYGDELYSKGSTSVEVKARQNTSVMIKMTIVWTGSLTGGGGGGGSSGGGSGPISIVVTSSGSVVAPGDSMQFTAIVTGSTQGVTWHLEGNLDSDTKLDSVHPGLLYVGISETASSLLIKATSVEDTTRSGEKSVTVSVSAPPPGSLTFIFDGFTDDALDSIPNLGTIYRNGTPHDISVTVTGTFSTYAWYIDGIEITGVTVNNILISASHIQYNGIGTHFLTFEGNVGGKLYSKTVTYTVMN